MLWVVTTRMTWNFWAVPPSFATGILGKGGQPKWWISRCYDARWTLCRRDVMRALKSWGTRKIRRENGGKIPWGLWYSSCFNPPCRSPLKGDWGPIITHYIRCIWGSLLRGPPSQGGLTPFSLWLERVIVPEKKSPWALHSQWIIKFAKCLAGHR